MAVLVEQGAGFADHGADGGPADVAESPGKFIPFVIETAHSRFPVFEDNRDNADFMRGLLAAHGGFELLVAPDASTGRELAARAPDAILLDVNLPDADGEDLLRDLKADPATAAIPVLVVTADASDARADSVRSAGAADYLTKPVDADRLLRALDAALHDRSVVEHLLHRHRDRRLAALHDHRHRIADEDQVDAGVPFCSGAPVPAG